MNTLNALSAQQFKAQTAQATQQTQQTQQKPASQNTKTSIFYVNDVHGQIPKMERLVAASQLSGIEANNSDSGYLKLCSGDTFIGSNQKRNETAAKFLDIAEFDATTLGNHEFDITASICGDLLKNSKTNILGMNMNFPDGNSELSKKVLRSVITTDTKGEKYGLIGLQPSDITKRIKKPEQLNGITIDDVEETKKELQEEVNKLKQQGINKIIVLSHEGNKVEKEIAQSVEGIDVILGGHSHDLIKGIQEGENLFYSPSGEPVVITQAGRDGNNFGVLNLEFNNDGQIVSVQNNVRNTNDYKPNLIMAKTSDSILGDSPEIGSLGAVSGLPKSISTEENPWADFVADAVKNQLDTDIALINSNNFRGSVAEGPVTARDIESIFPFSNKLAKINLSEKNMVDAIKMCAKSLTTHDHKPGIMQVSGLKYTLSKDGELKNMMFVDKQGNDHAIDVNNPDPNKTYVAAYDEFLINGGDGLEMLKPKESDFIEKYDFDKDKCTVDYIKTLVQPFEVKADNRIVIED